MIRNYARECVPQPAVHSVRECERKLTKSGRVKNLTWRSLALEEEMVRPLRQRHGYFLLYMALASIITLSASLSARTVINRAEAP